jgi:hypothetical protein
MEFKGTQGKWELDQDGNSAFFINSTERKEFVSVWIEDDESEEEANANAKLIAAAPELLEALIEVVRISDRNNIAWNRSIEVIKKATE